MSYTHLCNQHPKQDAEHFHHLREFPHAPYQLPPVHLTSGNHYANFFWQRLDLSFLEFLLSFFAQHVLKIHLCC